MFRSPDGTLNKYVPKKRQFVSPQAMLDVGRLPLQSQELPAPSSVLRTYPVSSRRADRLVVIAAISGVLGMWLVS